MPARVPGGGLIHVRFRMTSGVITIAVIVPEPGPPRLARSHRPDNNLFAKCLIQKHFQSSPGLLSSASDNNEACSTGRAGLL